MNKIEWNEGLSVGIKAIDADHKQLISIINRLLDEIQGNFSTLALEQVFSELEAYTIYHFEHEEKLMYAQCTTSEDEYYIDEHVKQHQKFIQEVPQLKKKLLTASSVEVAVEVVEFLAHWLLDHIVTEDLSFTEFLMQHERNAHACKEQNIWEKLIMKLNNTMALPKRSLLIVVIPFIALLFFSAIFSMSLNKKYKELSQVRTVSKAFVCVNRITDNLQKERGLSNAYLFSKNGNYKELLKQHYLRTSQSIQECSPTLMKLYDYKEKDLNQYLNQYYQVLKTLPHQRKMIETSLSMNPKAIYFYTHLIDTLIHIVEESSFISQGHTSLDAPAVILMHLKESSGLLRAEGVKLLETQSKDKENFNTYLNAHHAYLNAFKALSPKYVRETIENVENLKSSQELRAINFAISQGELNIDSKDWFKRISTKIEHYKGVVLQLLKKIDADALKEKDEAMSLMVLLWVSLFVMLSLILFISFALQHSVIKPLEALTGAMQRLSLGDKSYFDYTYQSKDVIGDMISAFENFRRSLIKADLADLLLDIQGHKADEFKRLAHVDPLTNALNRRKFREVYAQEFNESNKQESELTLLALDLDHFKDINDTYGHGIGDSVLKAFSALVDKTIRPSDYLARVGGEEFIILLPNTSLTHALEIGERICTNVNDMDLNHLHANLNLTVSIGVALKSEKSTMDGIIKEADEALYRAKKEGRNRVSVKKEN